MIVNVRSSDEMRHVYSPASSSDTSDKLKLHVQAYLNKKIIPLFAFIDQRIFLLLNKEKMSRTCVQAYIVFDHHYLYFHRFLLPINVPPVHKIRPRKKIYFPSDKMMQSSFIVLILFQMIYRHENLLVCQNIVRVNHI